MIWHPSECILLLRMLIEQESKYLVYQKSNGKWSLKNTLLMDGLVVHEQFDRKALVVFSKSAQVFRIEFEYKPSIFPYLVGEERREGLGIFTQDKTLKITPYDKFLIPSPMSLAELPHTHCLTHFILFNNIIYFVDSESNLFKFQYRFPQELGTPLFLTSLKDFHFIRQLHAFQREDTTYLSFLQNNKEEDYKLEMVYFPLEEKQIEF